MQLPSWPTYMYMDTVYCSSMDWEDGRNRQLATTTGGGGGGMTINR